ncbi:MAG: T9SS C-terminal target domain-containing protein [Bacteroidetes bacterium]|nr:MAG: T9SS C-terminal target domain-containing protein [Bacteroidota bacterium]
MKSTTKKYILIVLFFCFKSSFSQFIYREEFNVPVSVLGINVQNPWTGGHTSGQFYLLNLDGTGQEDLVVFDKFTNRIYTYIHNGTDFTYDSRYASFFPPIISWLTVIDYDCDGKKDIFTGNDTPGLSNSVKVYRNNTSVTTIPSWVVASNELPFEGQFANQNTKVNVGILEIPSVVDIENDGDIDIVVYDFLSGEALNFYRNLSIDKYNDCTHLEYEKYIACWGKFRVTSNCSNLITPIVSCLGTNAKNTMRAEHLNASVTIYDINGDGLKDVLLGDVSCTNLVALTNSGTNLSGVMQIASSNYPPQYPVTVPTMPIVSIEDVDGDNLKDMIVTPNASPVDYNFDNTKSIQFYKNVGNTTLPSFQFQQNNFLQDKTIDLGYNLYPSLADIDADGDLDLVCGSERRQQAGGLYYATLILFRNTGTKLEPKFNLENYDYQGLSSLSYLSIKPNFIDINNDKKMDMYFLVRENSNITSIKYILNVADTNQAFSYPIANIQTIVLPNNPSLKEVDTPVFHDISTDGLVDLLYIKGNFGPLIYYKNIGTAVSPSFAIQTYTIPNTTETGILFGGIDYNIDFRNYSGTITKLKSTDTPILITTDANGKIRMYPNFINEQNNFITKDSILLLNTLNGLNYPFRLSAQSAFATGDLFGNGTLAFVVGEAGGGMRLFVNKDSKPIEIKPTFVGINTEKNIVNKLVSVFPNPANESIFLDSDIEDLQIEFYNSLGVLSKIYTKKTYQSHSEINVNDLLSGIYFLVIRHNGFFQKHKLQKF